MRFLSPRSEIVIEETPAHKMAVALLKNSDISAALSVEAGGLGVVSIDAIAFLRFLELRHLTDTSNLAFTPAPGRNGTNSPAAEIAPTNSE